MFRLFATSRRPVLQFVLAICMPLCCCRVGGLLAMLPGGPSSHENVVAVSETRSACCQHNSDDPDDPGTPGSHDEPAPCSCDGPCCLKATTPEPDVGPQLAVSFLFLLPPPAAMSTPSNHAWSAKLSSESEDVRCRSLLRQRCALLI